MASWKRRLASGGERLLGLSIVPPHRLPEAYEHAQLRRLIDAFEVDCVFDVGANAGQFARMLREEVGFNGHIVSFEPLPDLAAGIAAEAAGDPRWHVRSAALDAKPGEAILHVARETEFSSLHEPSREGLRRFADGRMLGEAIRVEATTLAVELDAWRDRLGFRRPFLKLDTQGHDLAVAEGAGTALGEFVALRTEAAIVRLYEEAPDLAATLAFFAARGFAPSVFVPNNEGHFPWLIEIDVIFVNRLAAEALAQPAGNSAASLAAST